MKLARILATTSLSLGLLVSSHSIAHAQSITSATASSDALLNKLVGTWQMTGHVRNKPVTYTLSACRILAGKYVELHMLDVQNPPKYETRVFIGAAADGATPNQVIVHWLDSFGAAFSIPHATGAVTGDTIRFEFPYRDGPFRDTFVYNSAANTWNFRLESGDGHGAWKLFADYDVKRTTAPPC